MALIIEHVMASKAFWLVKVVSFWGLGMWKLSTFRKIVMAAVLRGKDSCQFACVAEHPARCGWHSAAILQATLEVQATAQRQSEFVLLDFSTMCACQRLDSKGLLAAWQKLHHAMLHYRKAAI